MAYQEGGKKKSEFDTGPTDSNGFVPESEKSAKEAQAEAVKSAAKADEKKDGAEK